MALNTTTVEATTDTATGRARQAAGLATLRFTADGELTAVTLAVEPDGSTLAALYAQTGAQWVDCVGIRKDIDMWIDDEGMVNGSDVNTAATHVAAALRPSGAHQPYFGNAVFTGGADRNGDTVAISDEASAAVRAALADDVGVLATTVRVALRRF